MLRAHRQRQKKQRSRAAGWEDNDRILATRDGRPINQRNIRIWRRVTGHAGVQHRGIHRRHTYGTTLADSGVHERVAQQLLGHADSRTTREIYTHVSERMMGEAVQAFSDAVDSVIGYTNGSSSGSRDRSKPRDPGDEDDDAGR